MMTHFGLFPNHDRLMRRFFNPAALESVARMPLNLYEDNQNYFLTASIPGIEKKDLDLRLEGRLLEIKLRERQDESDKATPEYALIRRLALPGDVNRDAIDAEIVDGSLTLTLPKAETEGVKRITVN